MTIEDQIELKYEWYCDRFRVFVFKCVHWMFSDVYMFTIDPSIMLSARKLVNDIHDRHRQRNDDWKRAQCYIALQRQYPHTSRREFSKAIEIAVDELGEWNG